MAGMFYTSQEVSKKLGKSEEEIKILVKEGKLREFRDGAKLLFKVEEVEALLSKPGTSSEESIIELAPSETGEMEAEQDETQLPEDITLSETEEGQGSKGISVLGESDAEYELTDDTMGKTQEVQSGQEELGKIEDDVSLDSFGSGSGLLDLSLQADDTSLGADILDDIYPAEGGGEAPSGEVMDVAAEAEQILAETGPEEGPEAIPEQVSAEAPANVPARPPVYVEGESDASSNAFGFALFVPLVAVIYTAIVAIAGAKGVAPAILTGVVRVPNMIWYLAVGAVVVAAAIIGLTTLFSGKAVKSR